MKAYDISKAEKILKEYVKLSGFDIKSKSRVEEVISLKVLFLILLQKKNNMLDNQIEHFYKTKGISYKRASIYHAIKKEDTEYMNSFEFRRYHDVHFKQPVVTKVIREKIKVFDDKESCKNKLHRLIDSIDESKVDDIYEMLELRIKSYEWKSKNNYEVIGCQI